MCTLEFKPILTFVLSTISHVDDVNRWYNNATFFFFLKEPTSTSIKFTVKGDDIDAKQPQCLTRNDVHRETGVGLQLPYVAAPLQQGVTLLSSKPKQQKVK